MKAVKTVNMLGDTQREQWHSVVHMIRILGQDITREALSDLCSELDRYIDFAEDLIDKIREEEN